jgi:hypothetical protein
MLQKYLRYINPYLVGNLFSKLIPFVLAPALLIRISEQAYGDIFYLILEVQILSILLSLGFAQGFFRMYMLSDEMRRLVSRTYALWCLSTILLTFITLGFTKENVWLWVTAITLKFMANVFYSWSYVRKKEWIYIGVLVLETALLYSSLYYNWLGLDEFEALIISSVAISSLVPAIFSIRVISFGNIDFKLWVRFIRFNISTIPYNLSSFIVDYFLRGIIRSESKGLLTDYTLILQASSIYSMLVGSIRQRSVPDYYKRWANKVSLWIPEVGRVFKLCGLFFVPMYVISYSLLVFYFKSSMDNELIMVGLFLYYIYIIMVEISSTLQLLYEYFEKMFTYGAFVIGGGILFALITPYFAADFVSYMFCLLAFQLLLSTASYLRLRLWGIT